MAAVFGSTIPAPADLRLAVDGFLLDPVTRQVGAECARVWSAQVPDVPPVDFDAHRLRVIGVAVFEDEVSNPGLVVRSVLCTSTTDCLEGGLIVRFAHDLKDESALARERVALSAWLPFPEHPLCCP